MEMGKHTESPGKIPEEQDVVMSLDLARVLAVRDLDLHIGRAARGRGHGVRCNDLSRVDIEGRRLSRIVSHHGDRFTRLPEDLDRATSLVGVGEASKDVRIFFPLWSA